jgi:hypothetical protein
MAHLRKLILRKMASLAPTHSSMEARYRASVADQEGTGGMWK